MRTILIKKFYIRMWMVPEAEGIVKPSTLEDFETNLKSEDGDPKLVSTFSKLLSMRHEPYYALIVIIIIIIFTSKGSFLQICSFWLRIANILEECISNVLLLNGFYIKEFIHNETAVLGNAISRK
jgi:hypothetical protein